MASARIFASAARRRLFLTGGALTATSAVLLESIRRSNVYADSGVNAATSMFETASIYDAPIGTAEDDKFKLKVDFPKPSEIAKIKKTKTQAELEEEYPWLAIDYKTEPLKYCDAIKEYCWEGNREHLWDVTKNEVREWYHAPWMHWSLTGREPLSGFTFERALPPYEFSAKQPNWVQNWAVGFYNAPGGEAFGEIWENPNDPKWEKDVQFAQGTTVFKVLMTEANEKQVPFMKGAPQMPAVMCPMDNEGMPLPVSEDDPVRRQSNDHATNVNFLQCDFAVRDDRAPIGWVFGTFMYDGNQKHPDPWDRVVPVGIMWGNDPDLTPEDFENGHRAKETWINPYATKLRRGLGGTRQEWGFGGRLSGPVDNFLSACASCHMAAQKLPFKNGNQRSIVPPITGSDKKKMLWFRNVPSGQPFDKGKISGDYSLQLMIGYENFKNWKYPPSSNPLLKGKKMVLGIAEHEAPDAHGPLREPMPQK